MLSKTTEDPGALPGRGLLVLVLIRRMQLFGPAELHEFHHSALDEVLPVCPTFARDLQSGQVMRLTGFDGLLKLVCMHGLLSLRPVKLKFFFD